MFGDTVNTASRMEQTGLKDMIQMSKETANLLIQAGKSDWVTERESLVAAKGKGLMKTYWLVIKGSKNKSSDANLSSGTPSISETASKTEDDSEGMVGRDSERISRLIDWNADVLLRQLKRIVAMRNVRAARERASADMKVDMPRDGKTVLDEVVEVISLSSKSNDYKQDPEMVQLSSEVVQQLRDYVAAIAAMYRDNPFHCFEHASHVTQSVTKLLARVVTPDQIDFQDLTYKRQGDGELHEFTYGITSDPIIQFACAFSALIHDVDHLGVPNATLVKENSELAQLYNCKSVAEQNSVELAWELLMEPTYRELRNCIFTNQDELNRFRQLVVNSVMATDICDRELGELRRKRWEKAFSDEKGLQEESAIVHRNRKATIVIEHLIQASDVAHTMQHWHVYLKWNERFFHECYQAYLKGRSDEDPSGGWYEGELGFFDFYIIPLAKKLKDCGVFGVASDEYLNYAVANRQEWEAKGKEAVGGYLSRYQKRD